MYHYLYRLLPGVTYEQLQEQIKHTCTHEWRMSGEKRKQYVLVSAEIPISQEKWRNRGTITNVVERWNGRDAGRWISSVKESASLDILAKEGDSMRVEYLLREPFFGDSLFGGDLCMRWVFTPSAFGVFPLDAGQLFRAKEEEVLHVKELLSHVAKAAGMGRLDWLSA